MAKPIPRYDRQGKLTGYQAKIRLKGYEPLSETFDSYKQADAWAKATESALRENRYTNLKEAESVTLTVALERWQTEYLNTQTKKGSQRTLGSQVNILKATPIAKRALTNISNDDVQKLVNTWIAEKKSRSTIHNRLLVLHSVYERAIFKWKYKGLTDPTVGLDRPKKKRSRHRRLNVNTNEEARLFAQLEKRPTWWPVPLVRFALLSAARINEILGLKWEDVDFRKDGTGTAIFRDVKNNEGIIVDRDIPLSRDAVALLKTIPRAIKGDVFPPAYATVASLWKDVTEKAGILDLHFHDLRHEALSRLSKSGVFNVYELAKISGHKDLRTLQIYVNPLSEELAGRIANVGEA